VAHLIGVASETLVLVLERQSYLADDVCAERSEFFIRPERYRFTLGRRVFTTNRK
jgi:GntR family transcriptional regulator